MSLSAAECEENRVVKSCEPTSLSVKSSMPVQPPLKKSRLLGDVDINSPEIQKLIHAKSAHTSLVDEVLYDASTILHSVKYLIVQN